MPSCRLVCLLRRDLSRSELRRLRVSLGEVEGVADSTVLAQKVLACVARVEQRFGVEHVVDVLGGASSERVGPLGHEKLSTYGLLKDLPRKTLTNLVYQLVDAGLLKRTPGDRPMLKLNALSWEVMRGVATSLFAS